MDPVIEYSSLSLKELEKKRRQLEEELKKSLQASDNRSLIELLKEERLKQKEYEDAKRLRYGSEKR